MNGSIYELHAKPLETLFQVSRLRTHLMSFARGKTLEIGAGTGFNFKHYPTDLEVTALEPDAGMRKKALERAKRYPKVTVGTAEAESLPYENETFDTVVVTLALCSVDDPKAAIQEAHRVLKPGGRLLIMEHVRKNTPTAGIVLDLLTPAWKWMSEGCHLNRNLAQWIDQSPFTVEKHEVLWKGYGGLWVLTK